MTPKTRFVTTALLATATACGQMLYIANNGDKTVSAFVYDQDTGSLTETLPRATTQSSPTHVAVHPSGRFALVAAGGPPALVSFAIDPATGALTQVSSSTLPAGSNPQAVAIDPSGKFAVVAHPGAPSVSIFTIDAGSGATAPVAGSPFAVPATPNAVVIHPKGFAYIATNGGNGQIVALNLGNGGAEISGSPFAARPAMIWMAMDPAGKFLYVVERQDPGVLAYSIDQSTGALTPVPGSPVVIPNSFLTGIAVDPAGKFVYVSNGGGVIDVYSIGANGALSFRSFAPTISSASAAILDPAGKFLYVPGGASLPGFINPANMIAAYTVDSSTGALTSNGGIPTGALPLRGATVLLDPPVLPPILLDSITNAESKAPQGMPNAGIAQGSRMALAGKNIGPAIGVGLPDDPVTALADISVQIQSGDTTAQCLMTSASNSLVTCVVPSSFPTGPASAILTYKGRSTQPLGFEVVTTSVGVRAKNVSGYGPAKAWNVAPGPLQLDDSLFQTENSLFVSAKPGQTMVVQATGLGAAALDNSQDPQLLDTPADVVVGNQIAAVAAKARGDRGSDFIVFTLPDDVTLGCYVPLAVRAGGVVSNVTSISISADGGGSCSDAVTFSAADLDAAYKAGSFAIGYLQLDRINFVGNPVTDAAGRFVRYQNNDLIQAFSPLNGDVGIGGNFAIPPLGTCTVTPGVVVTRQFNLPSDFTPAQRVNVGTAINFTGLGVKLRAAAPDYHYTSDKDELSPGDYTADNGSGAGNVGPFNASLNLPGPITWTNAEVAGAVNRGNDLSLTWTGGQADKEYVSVGGLAQTDGNVAAAFLCTEKVSAGGFTVPAWVLSSLPAGQGALVMLTSPLTDIARFTTPGLDMSVFNYQQGVITPAAFQ